MTDPHRYLDSWSTPRIALFCGAGLALSWCITSLWHPFFWDHGIMASVGNVIVNGGMPYRDGWDMKGPLVFYVFALAEWIFGRHSWGIRLIDVFVLLTSSVLLARVVAHHTTPTVGRWSAIVFILWYGSMTYAYTAQPEGWVAMLMVFGIGPLLLPPEELSLKDI